MGSNTGVLLVDGVLALRNGGACLACTGSAAARELALAAISVHVLECTIGELLLPIM